MKKLLSTLFILTLLACNEVTEPNTATEIQDSTKTADSISGLSYADTFRTARTIDSIIHYKNILTGNNVRHGLTIIYKSNGAIDSIDCYQNGNRIDSDSLLLSLLPSCRCFNTGMGTDTIRDLRDSINTIYGYLDGQTHGLFTEYNENGSIGLEANFQKWTTTWTSHYL